jgi:hypothetical protein
MICKECEEKGHYWFSGDYEDFTEEEFIELEDEIGIYAYCDMRQVYNTLTGCECGCHNKERTNE